MMEIVYVLMSIAALLLGGLLFVFLSNRGR